MRTNNTIIMVDDFSNEVEFYILEQTRFNNKDYILVTDAKPEEDGECYVLKDMSEAEDSQASYEFLEDENEMDALFNIFSELMNDTDDKILK